MAYYNSPTFAPIYKVKPAEFEPTGLGSLIGTALRKNSIANILQDTKRDMGESDTDYAKRIADARQSNPQRMGESDAEYQARIQQGFNAQAQQPVPEQAPALNTEPQMSKEPDNIFKTEMTTNPDNGSLITKSPGLFDPSMKSFETVQPQPTQSVGAPMKMPSAETPPQAQGESADAYQQRISGIVGQRKQEEPISNYYDRLADKLAYFDPQQAFALKQQAVKQRAVEEFMNKNKDQSIADQVTGLGMTMAPFDMGGASNMMMAGANLGLSQIGRAQNLLAPVAASMRQNAPADGNWNTPEVQSKWSMDRAMWVKKNPQLADMIPEVASQANWNQLMNQGGNAGLVMPEYNSKDYGEGLYKNVSSAQLAVAAAQSMNATPAIINQKNAILKDATEKYQAWQEDAQGGFQTWSKSKKNPVTGAPMATEMTPEEKSKIYDDNGNLRQLSDLDYNNLDAGLQSKYDKAFQASASRKTLNAGVQQKLAESESAVRSNKIEAKTAEAQKANAMFETSGPFTLVPKVGPTLQLMTNDFKNAYSKDDIARNTARQALLSKAQKVATGGEGGTQEERQAFLDLPFSVKLRNTLDQIKSMGTDNITDAQVEALRSGINNSVEWYNDQLDASRKIPAYTKNTYFKLAPIGKGKTSNLPDINEKPKVDKKTGLKQAE